MENKTPIEQWIEESRNKCYPKQKGITNTESNKSMAKKVAYTKGCKELLTYLGLSGIDNPREWVEVTKEERVEAHVSFWKEKAENNQWRCNQLQSEITKLQSELKSAKANNRAEELLSLIDEESIIDRNIKLFNDLRKDKPKAFDTDTIHKTELKQAKAEAWDEGYKGGYSDGVTFDIEFTDEDKATNPYKGE